MLLDLGNKLWVCFEKILVTKRRDSFPDMDFVVGPECLARVLERKENRKAISRGFFTSYFRSRFTRLQAPL